MSGATVPSWRDWLLTDTPSSRRQAAWGRRYRLWRDFTANRLAMGGLVVVVVLMLASMLAPVLAPYDPGIQNLANRLARPSAAHWLGTDELGRDILSRILFGGQVTLGMVVAVVIMVAPLGLAIGCIAGYFGGTLDRVLMRVTEFFQVLPALLFAMVVVTLFSPTLLTITLAIGIVSWTGTARLTRAEFMKYRNLEFVRAERAIGASHARILWRVILPNALPPLIVSATLAIGSAILFEAGLSFLGLGDQNRMSWGLMIGASRQYVLSCWWAVAFPGAAIFVTVLAVSLIGDGLNDALNPKLRER
jgi:peptide/nickel transport system permease protein